jgi:hypothetical protein
MVVLGLRPAISSVLRRYLLEQPKADSFSQPQEQSEGEDSPKPEGKKNKRKTSSGFDIKQIITELASSASTSAYLIFCTPKSVFSIEKDNRNAFVRTNDTFLTTYNHDAADEGDPQAIIHAARQVSQSSTKATTGMEEIVQYSTDRKKAVDKIYRRCVRRRRRTLDRPKDSDALGLDDVLEFVQDGRITNEETHYAVIMDPQRGIVLWRRAFDAEPESEVEESEA